LFLYLKLSILFYADDTVIMADTADDLQRAWNEFSNIVINRNYKSIQIKQKYWYIVEDGYQKVFNIMMLP
jgi:hypothetical protein